MLGDHMHLWEEFCLVAHDMDHHEAEGGLEISIWVLLVYVLNVQPEG